MVKEKKTVQLALIVTPDGIKDLNDHLSSGWKVVNTCAMPSSPASEAGRAETSYEIFPTCLVILEGDSEWLEG